MKDYEFLDALGSIDSKFVEKAEKKPAHFRWQYVAAAAACLALVAGAFFAYPKLTAKPDPITGTEGVETSEQTVTENTAVIPGVEETESENSGIEINPTEENPDIGIPDIIQETPDSNGAVNAEILNGKPMISGFGAAEPNEDI
ncbi:MAG: hypothetical protein J5816_02300, partial [Clostridia bacterium]|nr:hypothetical protein [Clostridia bacterium]